MSARVADARLKERNGAVLSRRAGTLTPFDRGELSHDLAFSGVDYYEAGLCREAFRSFRLAYKASERFLNAPARSAGDALASGDTSRALRTYRSILIHRTADDAPSKAVDLAIRGNYDVALTLLHPASDDRRSLVSFLAGVVECANGNASGAEADYFNAIEIGLSTSVHGGWFGFDDESLEAMRSIGSARSSCRIRGLPESRHHVLGPPAR